MKTQHFQRIRPNKFVFFDILGPCSLYEIYSDQADACITSLNTSVKAINNWADVSVKNSLRIEIA